VHADNLSVSEFVERFEKKNLPVVIEGKLVINEGCTKNWNVEKYWTF